MMDGMDGNINVMLDQLARVTISQMTRREIVNLLVKEWSKTEQYKDVLSQIEINDNDIKEIKERILDKIVQEIILNWKENKDVY